MKAFEEWFENYLSKLTGRWSKLMAKQMKGLYEYIWRAALEWVRANATVEYNEYEKPTGDLIIDGDDLKQELEDE